MTQASHIHSHSIITVLNLMGHSIHMPGECMGREQSCIGILIRLFKNGRISFPIISPTCKCGGKVTFARHFLDFGEVTCDEHVNMERSCKGDTSDTSNEA